MKWPKISHKMKRNLLIMGLGSLLVLVTLAIAFDVTNIGGTVWQFDYEITGYIYSGTPQGTEDLPGNPPLPDTYSGGGGGAWPSMDTTYRNAYVWWVDPDGQPVFDGVAWDGLLPDVGASVSLPWRVNKAGEKIEYNALDPSQVVHTYENSKTYEYYYRFTFEVATKGDVFTVPPLNWQSAEAGLADCEHTLTIVMRDAGFSEVKGTFADAQVVNVEVSDLQLDSGLIWVLTPKIDIQQDIGTGLPITNRDQGEDYYTCDITMKCALTAGLTKYYLNNQPYDVWLVKTVQMTLLLEEPLDIGATGQGQQPFQPPTFNMDLVWLLVFAILIILGLIAIAYIIGKVAPIITAAELARSKK